MGHPRTCSPLTSSTGPRARTHVRLKADRLQPFLFSARISALASPADRLTAACLPFPARASHVRVLSAVARQRAQAAGRSPQPTREQIEGVKLALTDAREALAAGEYTRALVLFTRVAEAYPDLALSHGCGTLSRR